MEFHDASGDLISFKLNGQCLRFFATSKVVNSLICLDIPCQAMEAWTSISMARKRSVMLIVHDLRSEPNMILKPFILMSVQGVWGKLSCAECRSLGRGQEDRLRISALLW